MDGPEDLPGHQLAHLSHRVHSTYAQPGSQQAAEGAEQAGQMHLVGDTDAPMPAQLCAGKLQVHDGRGTAQLLEHGEGAQGLLGEQGRPDWGGRGERRDGGPRCFVEGLCGGWGGAKARGQLSICKGAPDLGMEMLPLDGDPQGEKLLET